MTLQLSLPFQFNDEATFHNFVTGNNKQLIYHLQNFNLSCWDFTYLYGPQGGGKSHLLQACCSWYAQQGRRVSYVNFAEVKNFGPEIIQGAEQFELIVWDGVEQIVGMARWEEALFALYNELTVAARTLVVGALSIPADLGLGLADLVSRLQAGIIFALKTLEDMDKIAVLQHRASARGLVLNDEVANYLLSHHQRDLPQLLQTLDRLDKASMAEKRRLTIPFVKSVIDNSGCLHI